ncbi:MAG: 16S rRNA (guanine(527)-N(7))-methyltransferase RsmG [Chromatiaceae bacterium]|nr:16S rRNA (guanine(527)-N(7))-methyltransferase RsmG [Chromatiaceae bacterium]
MIEDRLSQGCAELGLTPTPEQQARLIAFLGLLARWNRAFNLTAVRDPLEMVARHLLDSLAVAPFVFGETLLDVGTGAGLPGLVLAILEPERRFWLLDSNGKKIRFVRQAALELGLTNVEPVQARIETYRPGRKFSTIVSRAVAAPDVLRARDGGLLEQPGRLLLMRGRHPRETGETPPPDTHAVHPLRVPFLDEARHLIDIRIQ